MNLRNRKYERSEEFKARQLWLPFTDAVGVALQVLAEVKAEAWAWFKAWKPARAAARAENRTLPLPFGRLNHREWQKLAIQVTLFPTTKGATA